jgi:hypothetical protein
MLTRLKEKFRAGEITFGLREAVILAAVGIAIAVAAAVHYAP